MHQSPSSAELNAWFNSHIGQSFDVVLAGKVFGGRYGESPQKLRQVAFIDKQLRFSFNTTEILSITEPLGVTLEQNGMSVPSAREAEFGWHSYGSEGNPENWRTIQCRSEGERVMAQRAASNQVEAESAIPIHKYFVQLVRSDA